MRLRHWFDFLFPPRASEIALRDVSHDTFLAIIAPRMTPHTRPETTTLLPFQDISVRSAIHEAKYHGSEHAFELLAATLAEYLGAGEFYKPIIVPIPLGKERSKGRGFNQVEEILKRAVGGLPVEVDTTLLKRTRETVSQVSLPRHKREENMRGAFKAMIPPDPLRTYIVIDDVITTGATLQAAINALQESGAKHIIPLALAH